MEAGLLAIAGGQPITLIANASGNAAEDEQNRQNPIFRAMLNAASHADDAAEEIAQDESAAQMVANIDLVALAKGEIDIKLVQDETGAPESALYMLWNNPVAENGMELALAPLGLEGEEANMSLWQLTDSYSGSNLLAPQADGDQIIVLSQEQMQAVLSLDADGMALLNLPEESLAAMEDALEQMRELHKLAGLETFTQDSAAPLVSFAPLPIPQWLQSIRGAPVQSLQMVDGADGKALPAGTPLGDVLSGSDASQLSDAELADLDALIEQIARQGAKADGALGDFRKQLAEQLTSQQAQQEIANPSVHSASHALQQTNSANDNSAFRVLHANPALSAENATPTDQVRVTISQAIRAGMDRVMIQLDPADLGRVEIRMDMGADGRAQLLIQADNKDTLDMLQRDARALERALQEAGIDANAQDMSFNLNQGDGQDNESGTNDAIANEYDETIDELAQSELAMDPLSGSYTLSIAQGLDIKI